MTPYPLLCAPTLQSRPWGGTTLARWFDSAGAPDGPIGEAWVAADLPEGQSRVANGPLAGQPLAAALAQWGTGWLGTAWPAGTARFPLLVKWLDAEEDLSVQVHPSDAACREGLPAHHGKDETWVVVRSDRGAVIHDVDRPLTWPELARSLTDGTVFDHLRRVPVRPGDVLRVAPGTIHALLRGVLVLEVQQPSDSTFRLYDYGRGRPLHLAEAGQVADLAGGHPSRQLPRRLPRSGNRLELLVDVPAYRLERLLLQTPDAWFVGPETFQIAIVVDGQAELGWAGGTLALGRSQAVILPAGLGPVTWQPQPAAELVLAGAGGVALAASETPDE